MENETSIADEIRSYMDGLAGNRPQESEEPEEDTLSIKASTLYDYDQLWNKLRRELGTPVLVPDYEKDIHSLNGFTGHRIVTFEDRIGKCALGFNLMQNGSESRRIIIGSRRKIYAQERRRRTYTNHEFVLERDRVEKEYASMSTQYDLGVMAVWVNKFLAEPKYED